MIKVSVIIPTYNYGQYIEKAVDSVLNQTYQAFEIIIVDDGSTDNTREIIETKYKGKVRYFYQENKGAPAARNKGIRESKGEYLAFLDADDWLMPGALLTRYNFLKSNPDYGWVYGPCIYHNKAGENISQSNRLAYKNKRQGDILSYLLLGELIPLCSVMSIRILLLNLGGFDLRLPYYQDYELWLRMAAHSPIGFIEDCNVVVVTHVGSISRSKGDGYKTYLNILRESEKRYPDTVKGLGYAWRKRFSNIVAERGRHLVLEGDRKSAIKHLREAVSIDPLKLRHYAGLLKTMLRVPASDIILKE